MSQRQARAERRATKHRWGFVIIPTCTAIVAAEVVFAIAAIVPPVLVHRVKQRQALADAVASLGGTKAVSCDFSVQYGDVVTLVLDASDVGALGDVSPELIGIPIPNPADMTAQDAAPLGGDSAAFEGPSAWLDRLNRLADELRDALEPLEVIELGRADEEFGCLYFAVERAERIGDAQLCNS